MSDKDTRGAARYENEVKHRKRKDGALRQDKLLSDVFRRGWYQYDTERVYLDHSTDSVAYDPEALEEISRSLQEEETASRYECNVESPLRGIGRLAAMGLKPLLINSADIIRASTLCLTLDREDGVVYSPKVAVFRDENDEFLPFPHVISVITYRVEEALARHVIALAAHLEHDTLIIGGWDERFVKALRQCRFKRVLFCVQTQEHLRAFNDEFS